MKSRLDSSWMAFAHAGLPVAFVLAALPRKPSLRSSLPRLRRGSLPLNRPRAATVFWGNLPVYYLLKVEKEYASKTVAALGPEGILRLLQVFSQLF